MVPEETAPVVVKENAVGLESILNGFSIAVFFLQIDHLAEKFETPKGRFSALPGKGHMMTRLGLNIPADESLQNIIVHGEVGHARIQGILTKVKAVAALQVAHGPGRFRQHKKRKS